MRRGSDTCPGSTTLGWESIAVPGTVNPPPDGEEGGAWYRRAFDVPRAWVGRSVTVRFASANYVADVWLNGTWIGYHEGGSTPFAIEAGGRSCRAPRTSSPSGSTPFRSGPATTSCRGAQPTGGTTAG